MGKDPAFLFYSSDFLSGTMTMTKKQIGCYIILLCLQHQKGFLTEKDMLKICERHDEDVFSKFLKKSDGMYYNQRLESEMIKRNEYSESRRENRKKKQDANICKTYDEHMENENENETITKERESKERGNEVKEIIDYLNLMAGTNYRSASQKTRDLIKARFNENYNLDDFKKVIDIKVDEWKDDAKMQKFIRPETLFSNKFESYLNQITESKRELKQTSKGVFKI